MTEPVKPGSPEWARLVTASKVSAILGVSPWDSQRSIYHLMRGDIDPKEMTDAMRRGHFLERGLLDWYFDDNPHLTREGREVSVTRDDLPWAAATPDDIATDPETGEVFPVDAKTDARGTDWGEPGTDQVPLYYVTQAMWVMHLGKFDRFVFVRLGPWLERDEYVVHYDPELAADIEARCFQFWLSLHDGEPPALDGTVATYDAVRATVPIGEGDWECPPELARELCEAAAGVKTAEARHLLAKSTVLEQMGDFKRAVCNGQLLGDKRKTAKSAALYPPRRDVDLTALIPATTKEAA